MPSGMELMLKSFGVDPEKIKAELTTTLDNATSAVKTQVKDLTTKIDNVQASCNRQELMLSAIMQHMGVAGVGGSMDNAHSDKVGAQFEERNIIPDGDNISRTTSTN